LLEGEFVAHIGI